VPVLALRPLGAAAPDALGWRRRAGQAPYREAGAAAAVGRWEEALAGARAARALDASHVDAAWLEARALGQLGRHTEVLAPLELAAAADWPHHGEASLRSPELAAFRITSAGVAWSTAAEGYRAAWAAAVAGALVLVVDGDAVAYDVAGGRWLRLTRSGEVLGILHGSRLAYVTGGARASIGVVDLSTGATSRPLPWPSARATLRWRAAGGEPWLEVSTGKGAWSVVDLAAGSRAPAPKQGTAASPRLIVSDGRARLVRLPLSGAAADWDDEGLASAVRIGRGGRVITPPPGLLVDGDTLVVSPDGARVAFAAVPVGRCHVVPGPSPTLLVADLATGRLHDLGAWPLEAQLEWSLDGTIAVATGGTLVVQAADGSGAPTVTSGPPITLVGRPPTSPCLPLSPPAEVTPPPTSTLAATPALDAAPVGRDAATPDAATP